MSRRSRKFNPTKTATRLAEPSELSSTSRTFPNVPLGLRNGNLHKNGCSRTQYTIQFVMQNKIFYTIALLALFPQVIGVIRTS